MLTATVPRSGDESSGKFRNDDHLQRSNFHFPGVMVSLRARFHAVQGYPSENRPHSNEFTAFQLTRNDVGILLRLSNLLLCPSSSRNTAERL